jgi:hypothetical protein
MTGSSHEARPSNDPDRFRKGLPAPDRHRDELPKSERADLLRAVPWRADQSGRNRDLFARRASLPPVKNAAEARRALHCCRRSSCGQGDRFDQDMMRPPSTLMVWPVM